MQIAWELLLFLKIVGRPYSNAFSFPGGKFLDKYPDRKFCASQFQWISASHHRIRNLNKVGKKPIFLVFIPNNFPNNFPIFSKSFSNIFLGESQVSLDQPGNHKMAYRSKPEDKFVSRHVF